MAAARRGCFCSLHPAGLSGLSSRPELSSLGPWSSFKRAGSGWHAGRACQFSLLSVLQCPYVLLRQFSHIPSVDGGEVGGRGNVNGSRESGRQGSPLVGACAPGMSRFASPVLYSSCLVVAVMGGAPAAAWCP